MSRMSCHGLLTCTAMLFACLPVSAADIEVGKAAVAQMCSECHRPADWNGETQAALGSLIRDIVSGKVPHRKKTFKLTDQEIENIAAYWTSGRK